MIWKVVLDDGTEEGLWVAVAASDKLTACYRVGFGVCLISDQRRGYTVRSVEQIPEISPDALDGHSVLLF